MERSIKTDLTMSSSNTSPEVKKVEINLQSSSPYEFNSQEQITVVKTEMECDSVYVELDDFCSNIKLESEISIKKETLDVSQRANDRTESKGYSFKLDKISDANEQKGVESGVDSNREALVCKNRGHNFHCCDSKENSHQRLITIAYSKQKEMSKMARVMRSHVKDQRLIKTETECDSVQAEIDDVCNNIKLESEDSEISIKEEALDNNVRQRTIDKTELNGYSIKLHQISDVNNEQKGIELSCDSNREALVYNRNYQYNFDSYETEEHPHERLIHIADSNQLRTAETASNMTSHVKEQNEDVMVALEKNSKNVYSRDGESNIALKISHELSESAVKLEPSECDVSTTKMHLRSVSDVVSPEGGHLSCDNVQTVVKDKEYGIDKISVNPNTVLMPDDLTTYQSKDTLEFPLENEIMPMQQLGLNPEKHQDIKHTETVLKKSGHTSFNKSNIQKTDIGKPDVYKQQDVHKRKCLDEHMNSIQGKHNKSIQKPGTKYKKVSTETVLKKSGPTSFNKSNIQKTDIGKPDVYKKQDVHKRKCLDEHNMNSIQGKHNKSIQKPGAKYKKVSTETVLKKSGHTSFNKSNIQNTDIGKLDVYKQQDVHKRKCLDEHMNSIQGKHNKSIQKPGAKHKKVSTQKSSVEKQDRQLSVCYLCGITISKLTEHLKMVHSNGTFTCYECNYTAKNKHYLIVHYNYRHNKHEEKTCEICGYKAKRNSLMQRHVLYHHSEDGTAEVFACENCNYKTNRRPNFKFHIRTHHTAKGSHKCESCPFETRWQSHLYKHVKTKHTEIDVKEIHNCKKCDFTTKWQSHLYKHIKDKHSETRTEKKVYGCKECDFTAKYQSYLYKHVKEKHRMNEIVKYRCSECDFETKWQSHYYKHKKANHSNLD